MLEFLQGKKTYIVAILVGIVGILQWVGVEIPEAVWTILSAFGLGAVRSALKKIEEAK